MIDLYGILPHNCGMPNRPLTSSTARLEARLPADVMVVLKRAAEIEGRSLTDFVVSAAHAAARRTIEAADVVRLSVEDSRRFAETILNPPEPNAALQRAFYHHRALIRDSEL